MQNKCVPVSKWIEEKTITTNLDFLSINKNKTEKKITCGVDTSVLS